MENEKARVSRFVRPDGSVRYIAYRGAASVAGESVKIDSKDGRSATIPKWLGIPEVKG